ncbi:hypothetical protein RT717_17585 [Imperialibacter roseus]|uniref:Addiction module component n=1 Tax=Imperialibacter roseus TaxID=1324217 RepID=A0ABZ0IMU2_9BACT|nr:hypothetical protein [Imperialibacter roseus]WOK04897.1 hypothetical protein RT717_17585 [Imperialibacter roseus]
MNIKEKIIERVNDINDPQLLDKLLQAIELEHEIGHFHRLTSEEKLAIDEGIKDADAGNLYSNAEASQLVKERLKK